MNDTMESKIVLKIFSNLSKYFNILFKKGSAEMKVLMRTLHLNLLESGEIYRMGQKSVYNCSYRK